MHRGNLVFAQLMEHLPMHTFRRCVTRYDGNHKVKSFSCLDQFLCMGFAQLTYRESLRDIEACLRAQREKLYHMGIRGGISRNTLANANKVRDWRMYADFAQALIKIARPLYANEDLGLDLNNTIYALDASTIDLCLSVFPWALFRSTKSAVKLHTLLDLRGNIPTFIHISDGKLHDVNVLDILIPEPGAFYVMDRGYLDFRRLFTLNQAGAFFVIRAKSNTQYTRRYSHPIDRSNGLRCDQHIMLTGVDSKKDYPQPLRRIKYFSRQPDRQNLQFPDQQLFDPRTDRRRSLPVSMAGGAVFQMDQTTPENQSLLWHVRECGEESDLDRHLGLCTCGHHQKTPQPHNRPLHHITDFESDAVRENTTGSITYGYPLQKCEFQYV